MQQPIAPIAGRPWTWNGLSERLLVSHHEHHDGGAARALNAIREALAHLEVDGLISRPGALKREEPGATGPMALHTLYFGNPGGEGNGIPDPIQWAAMSRGRCEPTAWTPGLSAWYAAGGARDATPRARRMRAGERGLDAGPAPRA